MGNFTTIQDHFNYGDASSAHTLIFSDHQPDASPLAAIIDLMAPKAEAGEVSLYGIGLDSEGLEDRGQHELFQRLATDRHVGALGVIAEVHGLMLASTVSSTVQADDIGRWDSKTPKVVLIIEEYLSLIRHLQETMEAGRRADDELSSRSSAIAPRHLEAIIAMGGVAKAVMRQLEEIMAKGRAAGVFVIATTRNADKDRLDRMRDNFRKHIIIQPEEKPSAFEEFFLAEVVEGRGVEEKLHFFDPMEADLKPWTFRENLFAPVTFGETGSGRGRHRTILDALYERMKLRKN